MQHPCRNQLVPHPLQLLIAFVNRHFADFADRIHIPFADIEVTLMRHKEDNPRGNRVWRVFRDEITGLNTRRNKFTEFRQLRIDIQAAAIAVNKG